jgi:hypothetical protein
MLLMMKSHGRSNSGSGKIEHSTVRSCAEAEKSMADVSIFSSLSPERRQSSARERSGDASSFGKQQQGAS